MGQNENEDTIDCPNCDREITIRMCQKKDSNIFGRHFASCSTWGTKKGCDKFFSTVTWNKRKEKFDFDDITGGQKKVGNGANKGKNQRKKKTKPPPSSESESDADADHSADSDEERHAKKKSHKKQKRIVTTPTPPASPEKSKESSDDIAKATLHVLNQLQARIAQLENDKPVVDPTIL